MHDIPLDWLGFLFVMLKIKDKKYFQICFHANGGKSRVIIEIC